MKVYQTREAKSKGVKLNSKAFDHAQELVDDGGYVKAAARLHEMIDEKAEGVKVEITPSHS